MAGPNEPVGDIHLPYRPSLFHEGKTMAIKSENGLKIKTFTLLCNGLTSEWH